MKKGIKGILLAAAFLLVGCKQTENSQAQDQGDLTKVVIGSTGSDAEIWQFIADSDMAEKAGLAIEVKEIDGGPQLNNATVEKQVDVNAFQSLGYLVSYNKDSNNTLVPIMTTYMEPMGIYSDKYQTVKEIKDGSLVALADNPANTARGLRLLEAAGLIKLAADFDAGTGSTSDIVENPKQLDFKLIDDTTGPRVLKDVDLALISNTVAFEGGLNVLKDAIFKEEIDKNTRTSINVLVTTKERKDDPVLQKLGELYHTQGSQGLYSKKFWRH
jgi:D-methionine transport system substrate-binding protein